MIINEEEHLAHYGVLRRSGRYPWGSGSDENTHNRSLLDYIKDLQGKGFSDPQIAESMKMSTTQLRAEKSIARNQQKQAQIGMAQSLQDKGYSTSAIGRRMGVPESSARALLAPGAKDKADVLTSTSDMLRRQVDEKKYIDVGSGTEHSVNGGVSKERLKTAAEILKTEGYEVWEVKVRQLATDHETRLKVLCPPGTTQKEAWENRGQIKQIAEFSQDGGRTFGKLHDPISVNPNRVSIRYKEDGGASADGVIYVRPGIDDVALGNKRYAQVRVQVGEGHYLKGMAMYKDNLPTGTDLVFNTNKTSTGNKIDAMKPLTNDPDLPFSSIVRQILADPDTPNEQ